MNLRRQRSHRGCLPLELHQLSDQKRELYAGGSELISRVNTVGTGKQNALHLVAVQKASVPFYRTTPDIGLDAEA